MEVGGWVQVSIGFFLNNPKIAQYEYSVLIFWSSISYILFAYTLLKVVSYSYYDLSVLFMSVMGFQKKKKFGWDVRYLQFYFRFS